MIRGLVPLLVLFLWTAPASAMSLDQYEEMKKSDWAKTYVFGVGQGFLWANAEQANKNAPPFYCQSPKVALTADNYLQILNDSIEKRRASSKYDKGFPIEGLLMMALQEAFPCK